MRTFDIVTLTLNPSIDRSCRTAHVVAEKKLRCHSVQHQPGGGGINVARVVHTLGGDSLAIWVGGGAAAGRLAGLLEADGVAQHQIEAEAATRENVHLIDEGNGAQYRLVMPGAKLTVDESERALDRCVELAKEARCVVASGSLPPGVSLDYYARLRRKLPGRVRFVVDTKGEALRHALAECVSLIKPNLAELGALVGRELEEDAAIEKAARELIGDNRAAVVVVSLGRGGALLVTEDGADRISAPTVPIRSKVGAGDSMVAGIVHQWVRDASLADAVRFGVAAGAAAVMTPGTELCRRSDVERLYAGMRTPAS